MRQMICDQYGKGVSLFIKRNLTNGYISEELPGTRICGQQDSEEQTNMIMQN